jgi:3-hydroxybutyryl-CoA dehydrogenase
MDVQSMRIGVVGAGIMGQGIALSFAAAGFAVHLVDVDGKSLERAMVQTDVDLKLFSEEGLLDSEPALVRSKLVLHTDLSAATKDCDFVVESITESLQRKKELFAQLEDLCHEETILSTNTSSLKVSDIAEGLQNAGRVIGTHFFNPAHIMPLVEIIPIPKVTTGKVLDITTELMHRLGKQTIIVRKEVQGLLVNRIQAAMRREIEHCLEEGIATVEDIDRAAMCSYGFRYACIGPLEGNDMAGLDTTLRISEELFKVLSNKTGPSHLAREKVERGELGIKTDKGWYDYSGKAREEILDERNRKLLRQLSLFNARWGGLTEKMSKA